MRYFGAIRLGELRLLSAHLLDDGPFGFRAEIVGGAHHNELEGLSWPLVRSAWGSFAWAVKALHCALTDHDWVDDSYGGPESGCIAGHCSRCGYSFHNQLY